MSQETRTVKVALLGAGTVGAEVARILAEDEAILTSRAGARLALDSVVVRNTQADRGPYIPRDLITADAEAAVDRADLVIELMGGIDPARGLIERALNRSVPVVTGNKALLATHGDSLFALAAANSTLLSYEAAVAGAIPILRPLAESLAGDTVTKVMGIVNGSTNYILDKMDREGADLEDVMQEASELGYLEADPSADVEGYDAAAKAALLASLSFGGTFTLDQVHTEGITQVTAADVTAARESGQVVKLLAIVEKAEAGVLMRVHPALISREHPLAAVHGAFNAVFVQAENAGELMFYGQGAGGAPTASAVMGDVVMAARALVTGAAPAAGSTGAEVAALPVSASLTRYALGIDVVDAPGVLARISTVFAEHGVSIESMQQYGRSGLDEDSNVRLRIITHEGRQSALDATVAAVNHLDVVEAITSVMRVEGN
ncbi:homoserine dehydrogenase [Galactobacter sp.]|uniref:homoserine dehydrogenase n=1 Tax=Galactobacter sp. TaxID=2676125 RepID=UPI0025BABAE2|nr:homoserine dehydrogenase [Galactobacter sp.]